MRSPGLLVLLLAFLVGCDRNVEPFVPGEKPSQPNLSKIFPPGAEQAKGMPSEMPQPPQQRGAPPVAAASGDPIEGTIRLSPELEGRVPRTAVLFLIARPGSAGPPLAVKRIAQPEFPMDFRIGPDDRMIPSIPFAGQLFITARVDGDGNATTRSPGDLQGGAPAAVPTGSTGVEVLIDEAL